jgi:hypothetical protein
VAGGRARGGTLGGTAEVTDAVELSEQEAVVTPVFLRVAARYLGPAYGSLVQQPAAIRADQHALVSLEPTRIVSWEFA